MTQKIFIILLPILGTSLIITLISVNLRKVIMDYKLIKRYGIRISELTKKSTIIEEIKEIKKKFSDWTILSIAHKYEWPYSIVMRLPKLFFIVSGYKNTIIVYKEITKSIPANLDFTITECICNNEIVKITGSKETIKWIQTIAVRFETERLNNPFESKKSYNGILSKILDDLQLENTIDKKDYCQPQYYEQCRSAILDDLQVLAIA